MTTTTIEWKQGADTFRRVGDPTSGTRRECWAALIRHGDVLWFAERIEDVGTPWQLIRVDDGAVGGLYGSLPKARRAIENDWVRADTSRPVCSPPVIHLFERAARRRIRDTI